MRHPATIKTDSYHVGALRGLLNREIERVAGRVAEQAHTSQARGESEEYLAQLRSLLAATEAAN